MPLPPGGAEQWPPAHCDPINKQLAIWSAWYAGDVEQLAHIYGGSGAAADTTGFFASEAGGVRGVVNRAAAAVRRWFWGGRSAATQTRTRLHVPIASDIASASSDLLFSEPPTFTIPVPEGKTGEDDEAKTKTKAETEDPTQAYLDELLDEGFHAVLLEAAEICAALGGVYLRAVWDKETRDKPFTTAVHPDAAVPEWRWGSLSAVTFWRVIHTEGKLVVRHLERHEPNVITHGVYAGTDDELGQPIPLVDYRATAGLADAITDNGNEIRHTSGMTARYVPNMRPNRIWRSIPEAAHLGRSDFSGVEPLMDALDLVESSLVRDVDLGKARLVVPREYMQSQGPGQGASVDLDTEVYEPINAMASEDGKIVQITQVQFKIRVDEHVQTSDHLKMTIVSAAGYSGQTFGLADTTAVTATEVAARERRSFMTRDRKSRYWIPELADLVETELRLAVEIFGAAITPARPDVQFGDSVSVDPIAQATELHLLDQAGAISTEEKVRTRRPDWDDKQVMAEVEKIDGKALENADTFTGAGFPGDTGNTGKPEVPIGG